MIAPPEGTLQRWAWDYITTKDLSWKIAPPPPPALLEEDPFPRRLLAPGRPPELSIAFRASKSPGPDALRDPRRRAQILHTFWHHELQAAELMAWALLAFPEAPEPLRRGLLRVHGDEVRHMALYQEHIQQLGSRLGAFPVRDWFWQRVPGALSLSSFLAVMGMGLEAANLDHAPRFAARFRAVGDLRGAEIQEQIAEEEIPHSALALRWYTRLTHGTDDQLFVRWVADLPPPLSPLLMRGLPLDWDRRRRAGFPPLFLDSLARWEPHPPKGKRLSGTVDPIVVHTRR
ncbi:MAG: DUF455 family protein [Myxococcales bacterium]|nr:ferritin-like domain-containing protein [Polyangiaceae bacterium]MDW8248642.1 DUF455 family protein [Myxococcales bacterium]